MNDTFKIYSVLFGIAICSFVPTEAFAAGITVASLPAIPVQTNQNLNQIYNYGGFETGSNFYPGYRGTIPVNSTGTTVALVQALDGLGLLVVHKSVSSSSGGAISYNLDLLGWSSVEVVTLDDPPQIDNDPFAIVPIPGGYQVQRTVGYGSLYSDGELLKLTGTGTISFETTQLYYGLDNLQLTQGENLPPTILPMSILGPGNSVSFTPASAPEPSALGSLLAAIGGLVAISRTKRKQASIK